MWSVGVAYRIQLLIHAPTELHVLDEVRPLPLVGCDDPNLLRLHPSLDQLAHQLLHIGCLHPVQVGRPAGRDLLLAGRVPEEHGAGGAGPGEDDGELPFLSGDRILEGAVVEGGGGEDGEGRVHAVLDLQTHGGHFEVDQTLKQALRQTSTAGGETIRKCEFTIVDTSL